MNKLNKEPEIVILDANWQPVVVVHASTGREFKARFGRGANSPFTEEELTWLRDRRIPHSFPIDPLR